MPEPIDAREAATTPSDTPSERQLGHWAGQVRMADDFDATLSDDELERWGAPQGPNVASGPTA